VARSRVRRRRQNFGLVVALVVTLCALVLVHDVRTLSAQSLSNRESLNRTFAVLATSVMADENRYGADVDTLVAGGPALSRADFSSQMAAISLLGTQLQQRTQLLLEPTLDDNVQSLLARVTNLRVVAVTSLLQRVGIDLGLPHQSGRVATPALIQAEVQRSNKLWANAQRSFLAAPGKAHLPNSYFALAAVPLDAQLALLQSAASLAPERAVTISAVAVTPAPFPAPRFDLVLPPTNVVDIAVVVHNVEFINQVVTVRVVVSPYQRGGRTSIRQVSIKLAPYGSRALTFNDLPVRPNEHAVVNISLTGAPISVGGSGVKHYHLYVASSPSG
jgi:hypothetical protein